MRHFFLTLAVVVAVCAASFGASYLANREPEVSAAARKGDAMAWLQAEFQLGPGEFTRIRKLHDDYGIVCAGHCAAIMDARRRKAPAGELAQLEETCVRAMTEHFQRVAAEMPPGQGERYLTIVLPRVAAYDHVEAPNLQVQP